MAHTAPRSASAAGLAHVLAACRVWVCTPCAEQHATHSCVGAGVSRHQNHLSPRPQQRRPRGCARRVSQGVCLYLGVAALPSGWAGKGWLPANSALPPQTVRLHQQEPRQGRQSVCDRLQGAWLPILLSLSQHRAVCWAIPHLSGTIPGHHVPAGAHAGRVRPGPLPSLVRGAELSVQPAPADAGECATPSFAACVTRCGALLTRCVSNHL